MRSLTVAPPTFHAFRPKYSWRSAETTNQELMSDRIVNITEIYPECNHVEPYVKHKDGKQIGYTRNNYCH